MDAERKAAAQATGGHDHGLGEVLRSLLSWNVLRLALIYFGLTTGLYGIELWLPQIVKAFGLSNIEVGFVAAIPYAAAIATMMLWATYSDRSGDRLNHVALACGMGCVGMGLAAAVSGHPGVDRWSASRSPSPVSCLPGRPSGHLPTEFLSGRKAAAGIAAINSIGNLGGFVGPTLIGYARRLTGSFTLGLMVSAVTLLASTLFTLSLRRRASVVPRGRLGQQEAALEPRTGRFPPTLHQPGETHAVLTRSPPWAGTASAPRWWTPASRC